MATTPPAAPRIPSVRKLHGTTETDEYAWMRDHDQPSMRTYLAQERAWYDAHAIHRTALTSRLAAESAARIPDQADDSVGWPLSGFIYRTRTPEGRENLQFLRTRPEDSAEELLLDENIIGAQTGYVSVGAREPSPDAMKLAWSADTSGAEFYQLRIRDLSTGRDLPEVIERTWGPVAWSADSRHVWYLVLDDLFRPYQLWRHEVGADSASDVLLYEENDARYDLTLRASRSGQFAIVTAECRDTTEVRLIPLDDPLAEPVLVRERRRGVEYRVDHARPGWLYIVTDEGEPEFTLMRVRAATPDARWEPVECPAVAPARSDTRLLECAVVGEHLVLTLRRGGAQLLVVADLDGQLVAEVPPAMAAGWLRIDHDEDYGAGSVIIAEESLIEPLTWSRLDLETGRREVLKRREVPGYDASAYRTEQVSAPARDGTPVLVTLAYKDGTPLDGTAPCLLYGYGAYEACSDPEFTVWLASLLDRGVVYAIAHIRGGGEGGRTWWQQGRLRSKINTFTDFIDVADYLAGRLVDGARIVSRGLSAGGLLQGAVYSMRPDRWRAVVAEVPFVDCVASMLDETIPLTICEWDEWGDPRDPDDYACLRSYSPYDNPPAGPRPLLLVTGAVHDARVAVHEPAKWVARLRATDPSAPVWFRVELGVGAHGGPSGRYAQANYEAEVHAFVLAAMGITA